MSAVCKQCGAPLSFEDMCIHKKMLDRGASTYFCKDCLAAYCGTTRQKIDAYIAYLRETGTCSLFPKTK